MKLPYKISEAGCVLYRAGVSYYDYGTTLCGKVKLFDYFQCYGITEEQKQEIIKYCNDVQFVQVQYKHAPEIVRTQILFPKIAWYRAKVHK